MKIPTLAFPPAHSLLTLISLCALASVSSAQGDTASPVASAFRSSLQTAQKNLVAAAEAMPEDKYGYKPTEGHTTFAQHMVHIGDFNATMCSLISGAKAPAAQKPDAASKAAVVAHLRESFAYCTSALAPLDDTKLGSSVSFFGSQISRARAILILSGDWADHYAVTATYLRLNGLRPPTARAA
jgi:hypothetical protein